MIHISIRMKNIQNMKYMRSRKKKIGSEEKINMIKRGSREGRDRKFVERSGKEDDLSHN